MKRTTIYVIIFAILIAIICVLSVIIYKEENYGHWMLHYYQHHFAPQEEIVRKSKERGDYWCIQGWTNTLQKLNIDCDVCFFGHSQVVPIDCQSYYPEKKFVTLGYWGDNIEGMLLRLEQVRSVKPEKVFLMCGRNDIWDTDNEFTEKFETLLDSLSCIYPSIKLYVINILPERNGEIGRASMNERISQRNKSIAECCSRKKVTLIDLFKTMADEKGVLKQEVSLDGLHLNEMGYEILRHELDKFITE